MIGQYKIHSKRVQTYPTPSCTAHREGTTDNWPKNTPNTPAKPSQSIIQSGFRGCSEDRYVSQCSIYIRCKYYDQRSLIILLTLNTFQLRQCRRCRVEQSISGNKFRIRLSFQQAFRPWTTREQTWRCGMNIFWM
jgi:hypothetical protein